MYFTICKTDDQFDGHESLMYEDEPPKPVLWDNPEGWGREGGGREAQDGGTHVYLWLIHVDVWQNQHSIVK